MYALLLQASGGAPSAASQPAGWRLHMARHQHLPFRELGAAAKGAPDRSNRPGPHTPVGGWKGAPRINLPSAQAGARRHEQQKAHRAAGAKHEGSSEACALALGAHVCTY